MKKIICLIIMLALALPLCACGGEENSELIDVKGAFYNMEQKNVDGLSAFFIVFDYVNDSANRTMPSSGELVTLEISDKNSYKAHELKEESLEVHFSTSDDFCHAITRYGGYQYLLNYGSLLGGSEPVRMFVTFYANPNDLKSEGDVIFTIDDQKVKLSTTDFKKIAINDEIFTVEENYEEFQSLAAFKWRLDKAFLEAHAVAGVQVPFGEKLEPMSIGMKTLFDENVNWGISLKEIPFVGVAAKDETYVIDKDIDENLPVFNLELVLRSFPNEKEEIVLLIDTYNSLCEMIKTPGADEQTIEDKLNLVIDLYYDICKAWDMQPLKY